jgi:hypothetical protein
VVALADGKRQVVLSLATSTVEIVDHPRYTRFAAGRASSTARASRRWCSSPSLFGRSC